MTVGLDWITDRPDWEALMVAAGRSSLVQSWAWGEAKAEVEGWRPRRAVLSEGSHPLAAFQVLEKGRGPLRLARINRGPFWLGGELSDRTRLDALRAASRPWRWYRGAALLIAPDLAETQVGLVDALGWRRRGDGFWQSAWLDLTAEAAALRKGLAGKWRNCLVGAEKAGLTVDTLTGIAGLDWLLPRYRAMMDDKGFSGIDPALLMALAGHGGADDLLLLRARSGEEDASAVLVCRHGAAATYLIGWNAEAGRRSRANYLLLWRAVLDLQAAGCRWFDLGGIDAVATPGVAAFKRGLGGEDFRLAGEFLSL